MKNYLRIFFSAEGQGNIGYDDAPTTAVPAPVAAANDGLSLDAATATIVQLGQTLARAGDPAKLLENREIPFNAFSLIFKALGVIGAQVKFQDAAAPDGTPQILFINSAGVETSRIRIDEAFFCQYFGLQSGQNAAGSFFNQAFGPQALQDLTTGDGNLAIGSRALRNITTAIRCIGIGSGAGQGNVTGNHNIAIGRDSLNQGGNTIGDFNIVLGNNSVDIAGGVGSRNIVIGQFSTNSVGGAIGDDIICIGTTLNIQGGPSNAIYIISRGTGAAAYALSNIIILGDDSQNTLIGANVLTAVDDGQRLQVAGAAKVTGFQPQIRTVTANANFTDQDYTILVDTTAGNVVISVDPVAIKKAVGNIKKISADVNTVTITPTSGTIQELGAAAASYVFAAQGQSVAFQSNATNLYVL